MKQLTKTGRLLYGIGIAAVGAHQLIIKDFRSEILPPFPAWAHQYKVFPIVAGVILLFAGTIIAGLIKIKPAVTKNVCLYLGFCFLALIITCQLPYTLILSPDKASGLTAWINAGEELAYCGGAFVMAGSFSESSGSVAEKNSFELFLEKLIPFGRIFFAALMILFGCTHFVFTDFVSTMVPKWIGMALFWTYFCGAALIASGIAIILKIWIRPAAFLLAVMLFLFFLFFHVPDAIANPYVSGGTEIVRAIIALLFCGTALVIAVTNDAKKERYTNVVTV